MAMRKQILLLLLIEKNLDLQLPIFVIKIERRIGYYLCPEIPFRLDIIHPAKYFFGANAKAVRPARK